MTFFVRYLSCRHEFEYAHAQPIHGHGKCWGFSARKYTMNHLVNGLDLNRIESALLVRRDHIVQTTSMAFNLILLGLVLTGFAYFLYVQYHSHQEEEETEKRIPFTPTTWYSATRNVRSEEYGRQLEPFEAEAGYGVQGFAY